MSVPQLRKFLFVACLAALSGCGFQLRGAYTLPYESLYVAGADYNLVVANLKRAIRNGSGTRLTENADEAQATFLPTAEARDTVILSVSSSGRAREKRLRYRYAYRVIDSQKRDLVLPTSVEITRDLSYADSDVLAKTEEENLLWRDMENDLVQQLMRRLAAVKPTPPEKTLD